MEIKDIGFYCPNLFGSVDYFTPFLTSHTPQSLTESDKPDQAYRKGVYLSEVTVDDAKSLHFNLLRCSSNLHGPTENFSNTDREILQIAQAEAVKHYPDSAKLNHVLAQVYYNHVINNRDRRAKIPAHSDKTEDMPKNGLIVFGTFYDPEALRSKKYHEVGGQLMYKNTSALTSLKFVNKITNEATIVPLHPNSALFIDLNTNKNYTHEIVPPNLASADVPTRLGYVIRCSCTPAVYKAGQTFVLNSATQTLMPLLPTTDEKTKMLKELYVQENTDTTMPDYPFIDFSLNLGDYLAPRVDLASGVNLQD